ncbi:SDR family NAD(P)-dependent oxidoreductase [uncultured Leifsonia sp.]|uniref:SDR family NAD(P)-dependent oxidoreductase n=1 Tax=uncultured Leifsonia sp. TaxID=340359 RepID=UPI0028D63EAB|nr:SDR family NAD(P)-dependent oxidoreductase [uncultured Leifsonia sp.]
MSEVVLISGAGSGFGALTARALADAGHTVYGGIRDIYGRNQSRVEEAKAYAAEHGVALNIVEMDSQSQQSVDDAVSTVISEQGRIDVLIHNVGHMVTGPAEAFTLEQLTALYDVNVLSTQRLNRAALPHLRKAGRGLVIWISSSSVKGGTPPYLGPYFAAKAAMDALAVSYADELARWGVETSIVVPGSFTKGTEHFATAWTPDDKRVEAEYDQKYPGLLSDVAAKLAALAPADQNPAQVAEEVARIVALPYGQRPFRSTVDPADDGSRTVSDVADAIRVNFLTRIGLADVLHPAPQTPERK